MEIKLYRKADLHMKIVSINQIFMEQEIRFFKNKLISAKPSFIIVALTISAKKFKIPQIYDKTMKIGPNTITSALF